MSYIDYFSIKYSAQSVSNTLFLSPVCSCFFHCPLGFRNLKLPVIGILFVAPEMKIVKQNVSNGSWVLGSTMEYASVIRFLFLMHCP